MGYKTLVVILIVLVAVFVIALSLFLWPKIKARLTGLVRKDKKVKEEKQFNLEKAEETPPPPSIEDEPNEFPDAAYQEEELASIKEFLKLPPKKELSMGDDELAPAPTARRPMARRMDIDRQNYQLEKERRDLGFENKPLPSLDDINDDNLWNDDLAKRLYLDDRKDDPGPVNPYLQRSQREKSFKEEFDNLSPEMKKILLADILKKKK